MARAKLIKVGGILSLQDEGRKGYRHLGLPCGGPMDPVSCGVVNNRIGNDSMTPILECAIKGPTLTFEAGTVLAWGGAEVVVKLNDQAIPAHIKQLPIGPKDTVSFGYINSGNYLYIGVREGWQVPSLLGSVSSNGYLAINILNDGDYLGYTPGMHDLSYSTILDNTQMELELKAIPCDTGPDYRLLPKKIREVLLDHPRMILPSSSRMSFNFASDPALEHQLSMPSEPLDVGMVQLTPQGGLKVIGRDGPVTGGYPRCLIVAKEALPYLFQKKFNTEGSFYLG